MQCNALRSSVSLDADSTVSAGVDAPRRPGRAIDEATLDSVGLEHFLFCHAGYTVLRNTSDGEKPRGLKPAARNTETENALLSRNRGGRQ